jgi:hypothetical protein
LLGVVLMGWGYKTKDKETLTLKNAMRTQVISTIVDPIDDTIFHVV